MGRRKKEPEQAHRQVIADAAGRLFSRSSIAAVTMDETARAAGYSKAVPGTNLPPRCSKKNSGK